MMHVAQMIGWAALAAGCTALSWRNHMAVVGLMLTLCSLVTSAAYFGSDLTIRLILEICQALAIGHTARVAFYANKTWPLITVLTLAVADCALAGALAICHLGNTVSAGWIKFYLGWGTNAIFALQCLCVAFGKRDVAVVNSGGLGRGRRDHHGQMARVDDLCDEVGRLR